MALKISRILHAGYLFECGSTQIVFDPIFEKPFSRNCYPFPDVEFETEQIKKLKLDAVFISHYHDDHCSLESLNLLNRNTPIYMYCLFDEMFSLIKELGFKHVYSLELNTPVKIGSIEITPHQALDADVDSIFHIKADDLNILNVVDSWIDPATLEKLAPIKWDMILWPFQTLREIEVLAADQTAAVEFPHEWTTQLQTLNPRYVVPSSCQFKMEDWSWYNQTFFPISYQRFNDEIKKSLPRTKVIRLNPSVSVLLEQNSLLQAEALAFIKPLGEQNLDYEFKPDLNPPPTCDIAKRFSPLTKTQNDRVFKYCNVELLQKYRSLEPPADEFFQNFKVWRLSIYDTEGKAFYFFYKLKQNQIELCEEQNFSWGTEVPTTKLYAALELGESLTSMYVRISVAKADIMEDPLIRCLFTGVFGAYQKAQLQQIILQDNLNRDEKFLGCFLIPKKQLT